MKNHYKKDIINAISGLFIILFIYAATSKLSEYQKSELQIMQSPIIADFATTLVWLVPAIEIIISILLAIPKTVLIGLISSFGLMCLFTVYIYSILNFADHIPCSCGGVLQMLSWTQHLIFNITFIIMAVIAVLLQIKISEQKAK